MGCTAPDTLRLAAQPPSATPTRTLAVIGGGAAGTAFLWALVKRISADPAIEVPDLLVFEPASPCGPGVAYRDDTEVALLNRPVSAMSVDYADRGHFRRWLAKHGTGFAGDVVFAPRASFGRYLAHTFDAACTHLRNLGGSVEVVREEVRDVHPAVSGRAVLTEWDTYRADDVIMCLGSLPARDVYELFGAPGYVHQPYPVQQLLGAVADGAEVLVLGTGLTAVDVALALGHRDPAVRVTLASRTGALPDVRCDLGAGECAPKLVDDVRATLARQVETNLGDITRLLENELERNGTSLREALHPFLTKSPGDEVLRARLSEPGPAASVQRCVVALTPWYSRLWRSLDSHSRNQFTRRYGRIFTCLRSPMPPANARRLLDLSNAGVLTFRAGVSRVRAQSSGFCADLPEGTGRFDVVVNATGRRIDLGTTRSDGLADTLIDNGLARPHPLGGLDVDPDSNEVLGVSGAPVPAFHVAGDLSSGVHFHTSSMEYVATQVGRIADRVVTRLPAQTATLP